jgi:general secretion pathway protein K
MTEAFKNNKKRRSGIGNRDGMALVLTLMVVAIITAVVVEFAYGVYVNTNALYNWQTSQKLSLAARSATKLASSLISQYGRETLAYPGFIEMSRPIPAGDLEGTITIRIEDENAKFNMDGLGGLVTTSEDPYDSFVRLLEALELDPDIADRVAYWVESDTEHRPRGGDAKSKDAKLDSIDELLRIPGIDRDVYDKLAPYVTIYGDKSININSAGVPVLMSHSRIDRDGAEKIIQYREFTPFTQETDIDQKVPGFGDVGTSGLVVRGSAFRVVATAESGGIRRVVESVLWGGSIKYWKEY